MGKPKTVLLSLYLRERKETLKKLNNPIEKQQNTGNLQKRKYKQFTLLKALTWVLGIFALLRSIANHLVSADVYFRKNYIETNKVLKISENKAL